MFASTKIYTFYVTINIPWCHEVRIFCLWLEYVSPSTQLPVLQWLATLQMNRKKCSLPLKGVTFVIQLCFPQYHRISA